MTVWLPKALYPAAKRVLYPWVWEAIFRCRFVRVVLKRRSKHAPH